MYIINQNNIQEFISKSKMRIDNAIGQNNYKDAFIIFLTSIKYLNERYLSDFIDYYEELMARKFIPVTIPNDDYSENLSSGLSSTDYMIRSKI